MKLAEWMESVAASAREVASSALGATELGWAGPSAQAPPDELCGIYIPLSMDGVALQLGVLATRDVYAALARALIGGDDLMDSDDDVFDAVGEITNLIAGGLEVSLGDRANVRLGVPLAMKGRAISPGGTQSIHGVLRIDGGDVWLVLTGARTG